MAEAKLYRTGHRKTPWLVSAYLPGGKRVRHHYKLKGDALDKLTAMNQQFALEGAVGILFDATARADYGAAVRRLQPSGASLAEAVQFYLDRHPSGVDKTIEDALAALLKEKKVENLRECSITQIRCAVRAFADMGNLKSLSEVTRDAVVDYVNRRGIMPRTRNGSIAALSIFFRYCQARDWMKGDPLHGLNKSKPDPVKIYVLTPDQVARLMTAAAKYKEGRFVRHLALRLFCGIRAGEVNRLKAGDIHREAVYVDKGKVRGRRAVRNVPLSPVARAWLDLYKKKGPIAFTVTVWRRHIRAIVAMAGIQRFWRPNICRKTWISNRMAEIKNEGQVAREAGDSPDMIYRHYFIDRADPKRFGAFSVLSFSRSLSTSRESP